MDYENIIIISFGKLGQDIVPFVSSVVMQKLPLPVDSRSEYLDLSGFYDPARKQYNGSSILKKINDKFSAVSSKTIGLFAVDLFIPILTYVFGQAYLNGRSGIASIYRLGNERYGLVKDDNLLKERFGKEVIHELGHMFGLIHCFDPFCVMRTSTYVEDIDQKGNDFCIDCREILNYNISGLDKTPVLK